MKILIVDDEPALSDHLAQALGDAGYVVDLAGDGERADFSYGRRAMTRCCSILGCRSIDGLTLLRGWRQVRIDVPVLVLTARGAGTRPLKASIGRRRLRGEAVSD